MLKILLCSGLLSPAAGAATSRPAQFDPPDLSLELELHRRFLHSRQRAEVPAVLAKDAYVENYRIQGGETLWSMSQVLYGDGNYWPRVWAQNHAITNPHLVRPGHVLEFLLGSEDDTPAFRFTEEGGEAAVELASSSGHPLIEIPPPEIPPKPVLKVPESFPEWQQVFKKSIKPLLDDRGLVYKAGKIPDRIFLRAFVEDEPLDPIGNFLENDSEAGLPVVNQYVYVKLKKGASGVGQKLMIARDAGPIRTVTDDFENEPPAHLVQVAGELQVSESVPCKFSRSRDREAFDCFRALMTKTTGLSLKDFALIPGEIPVVDLGADGPRGTAQAEVIGSERHVASMLFGQGDIVFLNKGSSSGVEVGQILDLFVRRTTRHPDSPVEFSPVPSGTVKIVRVTGKLATALILTAREGVLQGDRAQQASGRGGEAENLGSPEIEAIEGGSVDSAPSEFMDEEELDKELEGL